MARTARQKKFCKIVAIVVISLIIFGALLGILLSFLLAHNHVVLEVWPRAADGSKEPLISYKVSDPGTATPWINRLNDMLAEYHKIHNQSASKIVTCDYNRPAGTNQVCDVDLNKFYPCTAANRYNYENGKLCVFLKLSKVSNWTPVPYNTTSSLPESMPNALKQELKKIAHLPKMNEVWVHCEGTSDSEPIENLQYIDRGFPVYYFPYTNQEDYLSPLVAVVFEDPPRDVLINVVCKAWAKDISCEGCEQTSVRFQLKVES